MVAIDNEYLERFEEALEAWTDQRFVTRDEIRDLSMFHLYLVNLSEADGWVYNGHSIKLQTNRCTLVVKATIDGTPHVVFSTGQHPMGSIAAFLRKMREGWLEWVVDRYRG